MAETFGNKYGLKKGARSPGSTANAEHYDPAGAAKGIEGQPATIQEILADSTIAKAVQADTLIRVTNTSGATQYLFVGKESLLPGGAPTILNGLALPAGSADIFYCGCSDDVQESIMIKSSNIAVQIVILQ